ncbi:MAG: tyrosine-protein kinase family protein [Propionivibrio sp.]|uniref:XrtA-associated tyrosine autokinase n=1 Tax=Propionivibrio sp. TaxID=2212460 RepID=UPI0025E17DC9|nr:XrtA-associated tyrosine autokinase [Propionivibrio sp.]MBK8401721.1 tyrosine-protein kinase family protein [Propionivibrio sp.]MBL0208222.1 tyrosine-protein kinase family protein [Propionivibrio sp.]
MSLIEQAAQRLEQLRQAGVDVPQTSVEKGSEPVSQPLVEHSRTGKARHEEPSRDPDRGEVIQSPEMALSRRVELDLNVLTAAGILRPDAARSTLEDEFRVIKRPLIDNAMGRGASPIPNGNLIMITSALPGEGKTFTAANLAMSIAMELDNTVMLVDADVARPNLLKVLGLPPARGLMDVLVDETVDLPQVLLRTNVEKLTLLPSGTPHPRATELLASDAMAALLEDMANRYSDRIIIFDSPPMLVTTEARTLATLMGQVVIVVKAEGTTRADVRHTLATLEACPVKLMVLNQAQSLAKDSYGYGYGYGYGA